MSDDQQPSGSGAAAQAGPSPQRLFVIAVFGAVIALAISLSFGYADHHPKPHGVRLAVAAPPAVTQKLAAELAHKEPGGFTLIPVASAHLARLTVRRQSALGGFVVPAAGANTIITAGAQGATAQEVITEVLTGVSTAMHRGVRSLDVVTVNSGDESGLGSFVCDLGLLIASTISSIGLFLLGNRLRLWWRVGAAAVFALLAAGAVTLSLDTVFGALSGNPGGLIGVGFLGALSFVTFIAAVQALVGLPGTGLAAIAFVFVGNAISGGSVPVPFLPNVFRQVAPWLPNNALVRGVRDVIYYNGHDLWHSLLVFGLWIGVALSLLVLIDVLHIRARRRFPHLAAEIYSTPGIVHLRHQFVVAVGGEPAPATSLRPGPAVHPMRTPSTGGSTVDPAPIPTAPHAPMEPPAEAWIATPGPAPEHWPMEPPEEAWIPVPAPVPAPAEPPVHIPLQVPEGAWMVVPARRARVVATPSVNGSGPAVATESAGADTGLAGPVSDRERPVAPAPTASAAPAEPVAPPAPAAPVEPPAPAPAAVVHQLPALPANTGIPAVPELHRASTEHLEVTADHVTVRANTVVIQAGEVRISSEKPAPAPPTPKAPADQ